MVRFSEPCSTGNVAALKRIHMRSKVDKAAWIYVPMFSLGHWYLMLVDVKHLKLIYLDSYRISNDLENKKLNMIDVQALYLESLTLGQSWLSRPLAERPKFSRFEFEFEFPTVVALEGRMKLATDLVLRNHNPLSRDVVLKAIRHWRSKEMVSQPVRRAL
ncbi:hypothetical protein PIB30_022538 [Stylosanthes scabra]|uniref:Ubiquitin-like protease family profile domain-containing protein n=1 Tax=Stylosanthes scabra TaxID=79078 RepID=A0ABU6W8V6_9FABA|nr:hypothetical protein [Stylosanthes scabra]